MTTSPASSASNELVQRVVANLALVRARIASTGRDPSGIRIVAVTKTFGVEAVRAAYDAGLREVGENYVDELVEKRDAAPDVGVRWHFLGALQTNKIPRVVRAADLLCGVSRLKEIEKIAESRPGMAIYVQVNFTGAEGRNGAASAQVTGLVARAREVGLDVQGLMTVAAVGSEGARKAFEGTARLADDLGLKERSMGMSEDLELACEQGTSEIRVGRALFGPRMVISALT
jgi:pyridoxal phosphate enzyme (YggS family)